MEAPLLYPGRAVRRGRSGEDVKVVQERLASMLGEPFGHDDVLRVAADGFFGPATESAVKLLQTRAGLEADGIVGPLTWATLFDAPVAVVAAAGSAFTAAALQAAQEQVGVTEQPGNRGPQIEAYLASVGLTPGRPWCVAFVYWCFARAAREWEIENPLSRTGGVLHHWSLAPDSVKIAPQAPIDDLRVITPGSLFLIDHGYGRGHMGFVLAVERTGLRTIEGNTNFAGSREGDGVRRRTRRFGEINLGYIDWAKLEGIL